MFMLKTIADAVASARAKGKAVHGITVSPETWDALPPLLRETGLGPKMHKAEAQTEPFLLQLANDGE